MPNDLPPLRRREALGVALAQIVTVRLGRATEWAKYSHRVSVNVSESGNGRLITSDFAARATIHFGAILRPLRAPSGEPRR